MSRENVERVERVFAWTYTADTWPSPALRPLFHPDLVYHPRPEDPETGTLVGRDAWERVLAEYIEALTEITFDVREVFDADPCVVASTVLHGRGQASGAEVVEPYVHVYRFRDGVVVEIWEFRTLQEALDLVATPDGTLDDSEVVRRILDAQQRGDEETVFALYDEAVEWDVSRTAGPAVGREPQFRGHEGVRRWFRTWYEGFHDVRYELLDAVGAGGHVVTHVLQRGRGRSSGAEVLLHLHGVWTVVNGRVTRVVWFPGREDALEHARTTGQDSDGG